MSMIQDVVERFGRVLRPIHAGEDKIAVRRLQRYRAATLNVATDAFVGGGVIPKRYAGDGDDVSPPLRWKGLSPSAVEVVVLCEDPDAPARRPYVHWVVYGIPPSITELPEGLAKTPETTLPGIKQGKNSARIVGYTGPMPPRGHGRHRYFFQVFALREHLKLGPSPSLDEVVDAMRGHIDAHGELTGTYERP